MLKWTILLLIFNSCETSIDIVTEGGEPFIVADALITDELHAQNIKLYFSNSKINEENKAATGALVIINDNNNTYSFMESIHTPGLYTSEPFQLSTGINYQLIVSVNNIIDTAFAEMVIISDLRPDAYIKTDSLYYYQYNGSDFPSITEVFYDWSANANYSNYYGASNAMQVFYTLKEHDINSEFSAQKQQILFPKGTTIIRKKYSLSESHQQFIRSMLIETEWRGGLFDSEQANIPSNFSNELRGWFAVCMVKSDTVFVQ